MFLDGACVFNRSLSANGTAREERMLYSGGRDMTFDSLDGFLAALRSGVLNTVLGPEAVAAAAAAANETTAARQQGQRVMAAPGTVWPAAGSGLEGLLRSAGWSVVVNPAEAAPAPLPAREE